MKWTFEQSAPGYRNLWNKATVTPGLDDQHANTFATKIIANEARYRTVQAATGVPWYFIAALHMRESSCNFDGILHNGQKIIGTGHTSTIEPIGVGPFNTWEESAVDALKSKNLHRVQEWMIERMLYSAEAYNGWGYAGKINSPYVWAGTSDEQTGKYTSDHHFDPSVDDPQLGVAAILKRLAEKRPDIAAALAGTPSIGAQPPVEPAPAQQVSEVILPQPGATAQPSDILPTLIRILTVLQALMSRIGDVSTLVTQVAAKPTTPPSKVEPTAVALGIGSFATGLFAQLHGTVGPPEGLDSIIKLATSPTVTGTLTTLIPLATTALGLTGGWGALAAGAMKIVGPLIVSAANAQKKQGQ